MTTMSLRLSRDDRPIVIAALFILVILVAGTGYTIVRFGSAPLLSPNYLLQQTAAAILVFPSSLPLSAAAATEL